MHHLASAVADPFHDDLAADAWRHLRVRT